MPESSLADLGFEPLEIDSGLDDLGFEEAPAPTPDQAPPPAAPTASEQPEEPGRITNMPQTAGGWVRFALGGVLSPIKQTETLIEQAAIQTGLADPGSRLMVRPSEVMERPFHPKLQIPQIPQQEGKTAQVGAGLGNAVIDFVNFFATPEGLMTLGLGKIPATLRKVILGDFVGKMATSAPEQFAAAYQSAKEGNIQEAAKKATEGTGGVLFSTAIGRHIARPEATHPSVTLPRSVAALERTKDEFATPPLPAEQGLAEKPATGKGIAGSVRGPEGKWARATSDETGAINIDPIKNLVDAVMKRPRRERNQRIRDLEDALNAKQSMDVWGNEPLVDAIAEFAYDLTERPINAFRRTTGTYNSKAIEEAKIGLQRMLKGEATEADQKSVQHFLDPTQDMIAENISDYIQDLPLEKAATVTAGDLAKIAADELNGNIGGEHLSSILHEHGGALERMAKDIRDSAKPQFDESMMNQAKELAMLKQRTGLPMKHRAGEAGAISLAPLKALVTKTAPAVRAAIDTVKEIGQDALILPRTSDYRRSVLNWSAKLQRSFDEASSAQKEIEKRVPDPIRQDGITNWIQAGGDAQVLQQRAAATVDPKLKKGYEAALNLTPDELAVATDVKSAFDALGQRGQRYSVLNSFIDNYAPQIWDLGKTKGTGSSRTLREKFKFSKARTFDSFFDGEQAGFAPKTKEIGKLLPVYLHEMNSVIAARQLVEQLSGGVASDGRPLVAPRGTAVPTQGQQGAATLVMPKILKGDVRDYKSLENQPALTDWRWASKDSAGNPVFLKADLALHPEAYNKIRNVLGRSRIREWYRTRTSAAAEIPKKLVHGLDWMNSETKRTMLGFLAPFHQVQEGTHAVGHRINPAFNIPKVDLVNDAAQMDAARHGLMLLPDMVSEAQFMEGLRPSGLLGKHGAVSKIPGVGKLWSRSVGALVDGYSEYLFKSYIPGLKYKTYQAIVERNSDVYSKELASGKYKPEDIKILSAEQANAAYGHLNYADLARNPTMQHLLQLGLLAPDFLEARGRFAMQSVKGATGAKVGREQLIALGFLAASQAVTAWTLAQLTDGEWDASHPFEFRKGSRKYTMRSVPEDVDALRSHTRSFVRSRLSPIIGKGAVQYGFGTDYAGRNVSAGQTTRELATAPLPLTVRVLPGVRELSGEDRPGALKWWEQLAGSVGIKISRYNPRNKITEIHSEWLKNNPDPKIRADYEESLTATYPVSRYKELDSALADRDEARVTEAITELRTLNKDLAIFNRMNPYGKDGVKPLFHESRAIETKFLQSLSPEEREIYDEAKNERRDQYRLFLKLWRKRGVKPTPKP